MVKVHAQGDSGSRFGGLVQPEVDWMVRAAVIGSEEALEFCGCQDHIGVAIAIEVAREFHPWIGRRLLVHELMLKLEFHLSDQRPFFVPCHYLPRRWARHAQHNCP